MSAADKHFIAPYDFCFTPSGNIIGYYTSPQGSRIKIMDQFGKSINEIKTESNEFKNIINRVEGGGIIADNKGFIYHINVILPIIYKYDPNGKLIKAIDVTPSFFKKVDADISSDVVSVMKEVGNIFESSSIVRSLHLLDNNRILIQYLHQGSIIISVIDLNGEFIVEEIKTDKSFVAAKNGQLFKVVQPEPDKYGNLPNPIILIYKFIQY